MAYNTNAQRRSSRNETGANTGPDAAKNRDSNGKRRSVFDKLDRDSDGDVDLDDILIGTREVFQWIASHRFGMLCYGGLTLISAGINISAWSTTMASTGPMAPIVSSIVWATFQFIEVGPILDDLNLKASLAALVRLQRKPTEVPIINENLHTHAVAAQRRYRDREQNQEVMATMGRMFAYLTEACILIVGGGLIGHFGIQWGSVLSAIVGMVGVEIGLRGFCSAAEKVLSKEERDYMASIIAGHSRQTVTATRPIE